LRNVSLWVKYYRLKHEFAAFVDNVTACIDQIAATVNTTTLVVNGVAVSVTLEDWVSEGVEVEFTLDLLDVELGVGEDLGELAVLQVLG